MRSVSLTPIICFFGPDGSGKSTLVRLFRGYLISHGIHTYISWLRGSHLFASLLARFLSRFTICKGSANPYYGIIIPSKLRPLWIFIEFTSLLPHYLLRKILSFLHIVIGDRCLVDFIVWIITTLDYSKLFGNVLGRFLIRLAMKDKAIYVKASQTELLRRAPDVPRQFLMKELMYYDILFKYYTSCVIDTTNKKPKEVLFELLNCL